MSRLRPTRVTAVGIVMELDAITLGGESLDLALRRLRSFAEYGVVRRVPGPPKMAVAAAGWAITTGSRDLTRGAVSRGFVR